MPYIYAIAEEVYEDGIPPAEGEYKRYTYAYHHVPEEVAEGHENGRWKLVSHTGQDVTEWRMFLSELRARDATKIGTGKPLNDAVGTELAGGDFVMASTPDHPTLHLMEVVSFTAKKIRVRDVLGIGSGRTKNSQDVIKVDKSLFF